MSTSPDAAFTQTLVRALRERLAREEGSAQLIETHISWVLLAGAFAYKIKKPVRLSFLDFSTLQARHRYCDEELRLNRRLAPALYIGVIEIRGSPEAPRFDGDGPAIDYAVKMHRFADDALASAQLARGALPAAAFEYFALRLARFHDEAPAAAPNGAFGTPQHVEADLSLLLSDWPHTADASAITSLQRWFAAQAETRSMLVAQRVAAGRVRECHGDLHLDNLAVVEGELMAFDCLEFDAGLRWIDVMSELAFIVMDLKAHGRNDLAHGFVNAYLEAGGDYAGLPLLRTYEVYRALVRARVSRLRDAGHAQPLGGGAAADYLALAQRLARSQSQPGTARLLLTHGLPGTGKTWATGALIPATGAVRLRSDVERRRLLGPDHYGTADSDAVYARLLALARVSLQAGYPTIVDAAFLQRAQREPFHALASQLNVPMLLLHCTAPDAVLRQRVCDRAARGDDASQADEAVLALLRTRQQPPAPDEAAFTLRVDTSQPLATATIVEAWNSAPVVAVR